MSKDYEMVKCFCQEQKRGGFKSKGLDFGPVFQCRSLIRDLIVDVNVGIKTRD